MAQNKIGRYEIRSLLGRGGMASVYRGHDPRFGREVAVKILPPQVVDDPSLRARFEREARTIAALEHPAIVPVYDFGEEGGQPYLVMRLMTGGSLADRLAKGPLEAAEVARILQRISSALDEAHKQGVIHRDLKPGNILFDRYGSAYLSDFGIVRLAESQATLTGQHAIGTPGYMSPEQIQGEEVDSRTDIYALGVMVFEMLTGRRPYSATSPAMIMVKQMTEPVPRLQDVRPDLPEDIDTVVSMTLARDRENRPATAGEVARLLLAAAAATREAAEKLAPLMEAEREQATADTRVEAAPVAPAGTAQVEAPAPLTPPAPISETPEQTEVMVPSFAGGPSQPAAAPVAPASRGRRLAIWGLVGGALGLFVLAGVVIVAVLLLRPDDEGTGVAATVAPGETAIPIETQPPGSAEGGGVNPALTPTDEADDFDPFALLEEANRLFENGQPSSALRLVDQVLEREPELADAHSLRGFILRDGQDDFTGAIQAFGRAIAFDPDSPWHHIDRGFTQVWSGRPLAALPDAEACIEVDPGLADCYTLLGAAMRELDRFDDALAAFDRGIQLDPGNANLYLERGQLFRRFEDYDQALADFLRAIEIDHHDDPYPYIDMGWALLDAGRPDLAQPLAQACVGRFPNMVDCLKILGYSASSNGAPDEAISAFRRVLELAPDDPYNYSDLAWELRGVGQHREQLATAQQCVERLPDEAECHFVYAVSLRNVDRIDEAERELQTAIELDPRNYWFVLEFGYHYLELDRPEQAYEWFQRAAEVDRRQPEALNEMAWLELWHFGRPDDALHTIERALDVAPDEAYLLFTLAVVHRERGNEPAAVEAFTLYLETVPEGDCDDCVQEARDYLAGHGG